MFLHIRQLMHKEFLLEWRQKHTFYGMLLYVASTIFVIYLSMGEAPSANTWNSLFWLLQLFICVNALAKSFLQEARGRLLYYYTLTGPVAFILAKLMYNVLLMLMMTLVSLALFYVFLGNPTISFVEFMLITLLGGVGISMVFTLMSAIAAKAQQNAALMAILGFPVLFPQLLLYIRLSKSAFGEIFRDGAIWQLVGLCALMDILLIALSVILFPYLWKD
jgi:heme exporter protein B